MKKFCIILSAILSITLLTGYAGYGFDVKKKACQKACDKPYNKCLDEAAEKASGYQDCMKKAEATADQSQKAKEIDKCKKSKENARKIIVKTKAGCKDVKDSCMKKCD